MIEMYCREHHEAGWENAAPSGRDTTSPVWRDDDAPLLCPQCTELLDYSLSRIDCCPFADHKPTCARCTIHCYRSTRREEIQAVMRYAGPRMTLRHPYLALRHLLDRRRTPTQSSVQP